MSVRIYKPTSAGRRRSSVQDFSDVTSFQPLRALRMAKRRQAGRNAQGKITVRHRGGGTKRFDRVVDWKRDKFDVPARVEAIQYDPNRGARLAVLLYVDGERRYVVAPTNLQVGQRLVSSRQRIEIASGNALPLEYIPSGIQIHNIELEPGAGAKLVRGAGTAAMVMGAEGDHVQVRMPSSEIRLFPKRALATIGQVSNPEWQNVRWGKAGRKRARGFRPSVRGKAMNPVDHPHGGGEGHNPIGLKYPKTPSGKPALGPKTRRRYHTNRMIVERRKKKN